MKKTTNIKDIDKDSNLSIVSKKKNNTNSTQLVKNQLVKTQLVKTQLIKTDVIWNLWTNKSENISFNSTTKGVGDGEEKVAAELNTNVLGQNSNYDIKLIIDNIEFYYDVKKLDNYTFNTGVKGRNALRPIKNNISDLLNIFKKINNSSILTTDEKNKINELDDISPDELCVSSIQKINDICYLLSIKQENLISCLPKIIGFEKNGKPLAIRLDKYFNICFILEENLPTEYESYKDILIFLNNISHKYILSPNLFKSDLDDLVSLFDKLNLIFVDENKGYCMFNKINYIKFERITRGHPRFRVYIQD